MRKKHQPGCPCCSPCDSICVTSFTADVDITDNGDETWTWDNGTATPGQNVGGTHEAYQVRFNVDADCTVHFEGWDIDVSVANQTITLDGNTETFMDSGGADDPVDLHIYVCPKFIYVAAFNMTTALDTASAFEWLPASPPAGTVGTCLSADFASPPYSITPTWTIESAVEITIGPVTGASCVSIWPETVTYPDPCDAYDDRVIDCLRGPKPVLCHYGYLNSMAGAPDLAVTGFDFAPTASFLEDKFNNGSYGISGLEGDISNLHRGWARIDFNSTGATDLTAAVDAYNFTCNSIQTERRTWYDEKDITDGGGGSTPDRGLFESPVNPAYFEQYSISEGRFIEVAATLTWTVDEPNCAEPYPRPRYVASVVITNVGDCTGFYGFGLRPPNWYRNGTASADVETENVTATGWTVAATTVQDTSACLDGFTDPAPPGAWDGLTTTVTWTK